MFDIAFSEIIVVLVISLIVIGPEKLPAVARKFGKIMSQFRRYVTGVKQEIDRDLQLEELKKLKNNFYQQTEQIKRDFATTKENFTAEFANIQKEIQQQQAEIMKNQPQQQERPYDDFCGPMPKQKE